ncbi:hypothetical protein E1287_42130 [Actinomadura sp. KC06]|uniref:hypothetical protein n=1 Tax=Actinomadura sp. KC06 TaxID=2530369 RepID=UPI001052CFCD|nr:hypothetical protein [Actinomadura sp. KC06]TDD15565.1 hypothetical protein E1287_42130 [Actinomadura sp. KC06]
MHDQMRDRAARKTRQEAVRISPVRVAWAVLGWAAARTLARTARAAAGAALAVRAGWYPVCGAVLVTLAVLGLVAMLAGPLLVAVTGGR